MISSRAMARSARRENLDNRRAPRRPRARVEDRPPIAANVKVSEQPDLDRHVAPPDGYHSSIAVGAQSAREKAHSQA